MASKNSHLTRQRVYFTVSKVSFIGVMAAVVYVVSLFIIPFLSSRIHFGNTMCLLAGLLFGPVAGGLAAGIGSMIVDLTTGDAVEILITFASKFCMAFVAGLIGYAAGKVPYKPRYSLNASIGSVVGAWTYVALYMIKSFFKNQIVSGLSPRAALLGALTDKLPASAINAVFAMIIAPILWHALRPVLLRMPVYRRMVVMGNPFRRAKQ